jgi:signal transduction histidine kinase
MRWNNLSARVARLDLRAKVVVVLFLVIGPTFLLVSLAVSQITVPVVEGEMRTLGVHASRALAEEIYQKKLLSSGREKELERRLMQTFYLQPNVVQVDAYRALENGGYKALATTDELTEASPPPGGRLPENGVSRRQALADENDYWEIWAPVKNKRGQLLGAVRMEVSLRSTASLVSAVWKVTGLAGATSILLLLISLSYFLRKTIQNDRMLRQAESQNVELSAQLREAERQLMMKEKLAVMGQLTASFAHEIGTPLNAVGGHLHLLHEELSQAQSVKKDAWLHRLGVVSEQLEKIENIVKGFLHNTAKPASQFQLMDLNQVMEKTLSIVSPRLDSLQVDLEKKLDHRLAPLRAVPLDIEQVLLNLLNNSLDSIQSKRRQQPHYSPRLEVFSRYQKNRAEEWLELGVLDTGEGIPKRDLDRVFQPFYTTKAAGEGTGLGLPICREIAGKYRGRLDIESKEGAWTKVTLRMPYGSIG